MRLFTRIVVLIVFLSSWFACKKTTGKCLPETFEYSFFKSKHIDTTKLLVPDPQFEFYSYQINAGDKSVFSYTYNFRDCPEIADDEGSRKILFEIPQNADSFLLNDSSKLRSAKCILSLSCECYPSQPFFIKAGSIEGRKINADTWNIKASLSINPQSTINFENIFKAR